MRRPLVGAALLVGAVLLIHGDADRDTPRTTSRSAPPRGTTSKSGSRACYDPRVAAPDSRPPIRHISDTARMTAMYRARESDRPDALFRDPFARRLAGILGEQILDALPTRSTWAWVTRTYLFDTLITQQIQQGADLVVNLAAGLDARPYRMQLPASLRWVEIDLPELVAWKQEALAADRPACRLERIGLDLEDVAGRRAVFERLGASATKALIITEGILIYLSNEDVAAFAQDLARPAAFQRWILDLSSPALLRMIQKDKLGQSLDRAASPLKFGPPEGVDFFRPCGWRPLEVRSLLHTAASLGRLTVFMRLLAMLPDTESARRSRPWGGVCLMERV
jgi:methyltransferase (TIGR00027 family)